MEDACRRTGGLILLLIDGPSGAGKSTLLDYLRIHLADRIQVGTKFTTRPRRQGDNDWEFHFVTAIPPAAEGLAFDSVAHRYAIDAMAAAQAARDGKIYCVTCTDRATIVRLKQQHRTCCVYLARPLANDALMELLIARGTVDTDIMARLAEHREAGVDYIDKLALIDHVILNDSSPEHLFRQFDAILALYRGPMQAPS